MIDLEKFTTLVEQELEVEGLGPDTDYRDLDEWSSLHALLLIAMIDNQFGVTITGSDLQGSNSVRDIYTLVSDRLQ